MVLTRAVMSSMKRSGKRFFLGDSSRSVKYKWCMMLLTWNEKGSRTHHSSYNLNSRGYTFKHKGGSMETNMGAEVLTMSSKKNQACCRAPSLTLPLLTTHCRASSSWKSCEQEGTISKTFTIKYTAYRSLHLSSSEGDKMVLWHNVHCDAARVDSLFYGSNIKHK